MSMDRERSLALRRRRAQWAGAVLVALVIGTLPAFGGVAYLALTLRDAADVPFAASYSVIGLLTVAAAAVLLQSVLARPAARPVTIVGAASVCAGAAAIVWSSAPLATGIVDGFVVWQAGVVVALVGTVMCLSAWLRTAALDRVLQHGDGLTRWDARQVRTATVLATVACLAMAVVVTIDALEWGPRSQTEGLALGEILLQLSEADRTSGVASLVMGVGLAFAFSAVPMLVAVGMRRRAAIDRMRAVISVALVTVGGIVMVHTLGTFSLGMSIADTLPPYAGSQSPQWQVFFPAGTVLACLGIVLALGWARASEAPPQPVVHEREPQTLG